jgi:hypothetical protein
MKQIAPIVILLFLTTQGYAADTEREKIGEALGKPVYRDQIVESHDLYGQLHRLFRMPFQKEFLAAHEKELKANDWEIAYVAGYLKKKNDEDLKKEDSELNQKLALTKKEIEKIETKLSNKDLSGAERKKLEMEKDYWQTMLQPPGKDFARTMFSGWKFHRYLYDNFGGGRVIWSKKVLLPFDAMLKWLKHHEEKGDFKITDPELHKVFYSYWSANEDSPFFLDERRIQSEFIHPAWEPVSENKPKQ